MEDRNYRIYDSKDIGEVQVTEEVIAIIAALAATEVEGVHSMAGGITNELVSMLGKKNLSAGVDVRYENDEINVLLSLVIRYGYNIPEVTAKVQENVKEEIENMTDIKVGNVDVRVANVNIEN